MTGARALAPALLLGVLAAAAQTPLRAHYTIDPTRSRATIEVGKSGPLSFAAGHTHEVAADGIAGDITVDPADVKRSSVHVVIDATRLKVAGAHEPPGDVPKVQQTMDGEQVLDVGRHRTITFDSTGIELKRRAVDALDLLVQGRLTLRGATRDISVPVAVALDGASFTATGRFPIRQTDFGIKPVSVGGVVSVKDTVNISFTIAGR